MAAYKAYDKIAEYYLEERRKMHGVKRVLVFCILIVILPASLIIIPLYLRRIVFADVTYPVAESDIIEIRDGISSIFCEQHSLRMNSNFNAFQLSSKPEISTNRKHIRLKKSMTLPDDTLEYWGFYLLKGALVHLKFCSRYDGSRILVVKGQRELQTCGLLDHNKNKVDANFARGHDQVKVFFEDITEIAENVPLENFGKRIQTEAITFTNSNDDSMEVENKADEDLSEENVVKFKKKMKKDLLNSSRHRKTETEVNERASGIKEHSNRRSKENAKVSISDNEDKSYEYERRKKQLYEQLYKRRIRRDHIYDRKYSHGGNAINFTETDESNSISSFETGLFECFNGAILLAEGFPPTAECANAHFLENGSHRMLSKHEINEDGYYYYIFYSDNDLVRNDIHAIFDIYKPTFQYSNISNSQHCVNATNCTFLISFLSDEIVVVEVPTRDGIEHEDDDITYLISTCHPRPEIYAIFPVLVLLLILSCSFL
uniref:E3 ubiquitin-protein ligase APD1-4 middle domain-containing protein n=1 Tax=Glossina pallidipes TaxID=7398 RepID=A0A1A9ZHQ6_GLOPL